MLWDDALEGFWLEKRRNVSPHTVSDYALTFTRFRAFVGGDVDFEEITTDQVRKFLGGLQAQGLSAKSVSNCWTALSSLWSWAERELEIKHVIRGRVARPRYHRPVIEPYSRTDIGALLNACAENAQWQTRKGKEVKSEREWKLRDRAIILVLVDTGIRAQELCDLVVKDYENKLGRLLVQLEIGVELVARHEDVHPISGHALEVPGIPESVQRARNDASIGQIPFVFISRRSAAADPIRRC